MYFHVYIQFSLALYKQTHNLYISVCISKRGEGENDERDLGEGRDENENICIYTYFLALYKYKHILYICVCIKVRETKERTRLASEIHLDKGKIVTICYKVQSN